MSILFTASDITQTDWGQGSDSVLLSVKHLFLRPAGKEQKHLIDCLLTCFQLYTQGPLF